MRAPNLMVRRRVSAASGRCFASPAAQIAMRRAARDGLRARELDVGAESFCCVEVCTPDQDEAERGPSQFGATAPRL